MHEFKVGQRYRFGSEEKGTVHEVSSANVSGVSIRPGFSGGDTEGWAVKYMRHLIAIGALTLLEPKVIELRLCDGDIDQYQYISRVIWDAASSVQELKVTIEVVR